MNNYRATNRFYFDKIYFAHEVIKASNFKKLSIKKYELMHEFITGFLEQRIWNKIAEVATDEEIFLIEKLKYDHPNITQLEVLEMVAKNSKNIEIQVAEVVNAVFKELVNSYLLLNIYNFNNVNK